MGFFLFIENSCTGKVERIENIFPTERAAVDYAQKYKETIVGICTVEQYRESLSSQQGMQPRSQEVRYAPQPPQEAEYQEDTESPRKRRPELPVFRFTKYRPVGRITFKPETTNGKGVKRKNK